MNGNLKKLVIQAIVETNGCSMDEAAKILDEGRCYCLLNVKNDEDLGRAALNARIFSDIPEYAKHIYSYESLGRVARYIGYSIASNGIAVKIANLVNLS